MGPYDDLHNILILHTLYIPLKKQRVPRLDQALNIDLNSFFIRERYNPKFTGVIHYSFRGGIGIRTKNVLFAFIFDLLK